MILDEPTADLDPQQRERSCRRRSGDWRAQRTMLVIAHRPELVQHADRVVRLVDGAAVPEADRAAA